MDFNEALINSYQNGIHVLINMFDETKTLARECTINLARTGVNLSLIHVTILVVKMVRTGKMKMVRNRLLKNGWKQTIIGRRKNISLIAQNSMTM
jgi:hypothetical protein